MIDIVHSEQDMAKQVRSPLLEKLVAKGAKSAAAWLRWEVDLSFFLVQKLFFWEMEGSNQKFA